MSVSRKSVVFIKSKRLTSGKQIWVSGSLTFLPKSVWWWTSILRAQLARDFTAALSNHTGTREKWEKLKQSAWKTWLKVMAVAILHGVMVRDLQPCFLYLSLNQGMPGGTHGVRGLPSHLPMETLALNTFLPLEGSSQCCLGEPAVHVKKVFWPSLASPTG